ncbi:MAG: NADH:flavin oxidoreductase/NADH oxidase [Gammaproteobacteria bacterium]|nr:NADH:flavin oxidoreductase/NADH oxidase [Gammaproteobacteria bacterium]
MSQLFSPLTIKDITLRNRIGVAPMCQYQAVDGVAQPWHMSQLGSKAVGGAGLVIAEATAVLPEGRITPACMGLWNDAQVEALKPIIAFIKQQGAVAGVQLAHSGRKGSSAPPWLGGQQLTDEQGGWHTMGPTNTPFDDDGTRLWKAPHAMNQTDIDEVQNAFVAAAQRAINAGYEFLEVHCAHGYLLHSFLSPLVNTRTDTYGGDLKSRAKMLLDTTSKVRAVWPQGLPLAVRLSMTDWVDGGLSVQDNIQVATWLKELGVDLIDCSSGGATPAARGSINGGIAQQVGMAADLRQSTGLMSMAVGEITQAKQAENIIASRQADIVLLARAMLRDPYWPTHAAQELGVEITQVMPPLHQFFIGR